jgi:restriction system protein
MKKESQAAAELENARAKWSQECRSDDANYQRALKDYGGRVAKWELARDEHKAKLEEQHAQIDSLRDDYKAGVAPAVEYFFAEVLNHSVYPEGFPQGNILNFNQSSGVLIVDFELPNQPAFPTTKEVKYVAVRQQFQDVPVSDTWLKKTYDEVLYQIALRTIHELYVADDSAVLKSVVFNGWVHSIDKATGAEAHGCILSVQASGEEFLEINLSQVEPKACFRKLKGVASSKLTELTPVRPILSISREDRRFVEGYAVADSLDDRTNLAAMDWLDFENLIRELFEQVFSKNGGEVKITQASRDGGVDAIAFDPDPIRGGKIIIQAKRYTNVVGVSAVRDLFGTVHNEGAIKGILVTTATYGPDAYEFAKDKLLTLLSGSELLSLLADYGHRAKIDLQEAKALYLSRQI